MPLYVNTDDYHAALDQIVAAPSADPLLDLRSRITIILGEVLDIWPDSIRDESEAAVREAA
jgi:hypothetical protein